MRAFTSVAIFAALIAIPINAHAQGGPPISQVEVVNLPAVQDVNVTNPTSCDEPVVIAGATTAVFTGKIGGLGGLWTAHEKCDAEFPGSRMCDGVVVRTEVFPPYPTLPVAGSWVNGGQSDCHD